MTVEMRAGLPILAFADKQAFEDWLSLQPFDAAGAWIKLVKKGADTAAMSSAQAVEAALCHGWIDGQLDKYDDGHWLVRFTPRKTRSRWSAINCKRAEALIEAGRMAPAGLAQVEAARGDGRWDKAYAPASRATVPADFQSALDRSPEAAAFFATLKGANRYAILYRIEAVKKAETRSKKIETFVAMLARGETIYR